TKKLAGIKSKEVQGEGYGQLRFDDTTGQISTQLQNTHGASQLNLGNLSHPKATAESEGRGEGFELRTDQWGAVRAGEGILISTYKQEEAKANHLDASEAKQQLESSLNNAKALSEVAKNQQTDPLSLLENLQGYLKNLESEDQSKAAAFKQAIMLLASPSSIAVESNEDIHLSADGQINQIAQGSINTSTQDSIIGHASKKISLFAAQEGARLYAGKGKIEIQAQGDGADLIARKGVQIISTEDTIYITSPNEINLTAGGSQVKLNSSGILPTTGGKFEVKAGQHKFIGGEKVDVPPLKLNSSPCYLTYQVTDFDGKPLANKNYLIFMSDGSLKKGKTNSDGETVKIETAGPEKVQVYIEDEDHSGYKINHKES
ncbi:type VI secretion system Vgr family protein, partial [Acinetobacter sp. YH12239]|uniref:DUF2345 domain-containing protein n=1 Tax=Acinetobacter sp. YH12239 TaxID=2601166 RepID=UPI0015D387E7